MNSVVVSLNGMDFLQGEPGSCNETHETNTLDGNQVASVEAAINTEPNVSGATVVSVKYISYKLYPQLPARASVFPCETRI